MSGRHPRAMQPADERAHPVIQDAIDKGHLENGEPYYVTGLPNHETANQARLTVGRGLVHHNFARAAWVVDADKQPCNPLKQPCADENAPHGVAFHLYSKNAARKHIYQQTGGDPAKLKYNPFGQKPRAYDDNGQQRST